MVCSKGVGKVPSIASRLEPIVYPLKQGGVICFEIEDVVCLCLVNLGGNAILGSHGIEGDDTALQLKQFQQGYKNIAKTDSPLHTIEMPIHTNVQVQRAVCFLQVSARGRNRCIFI